MSTKSIWQHIKTEGLYDLMEMDAVFERDLTKAVVYRSLKDGVVWVRDKDEFFDGRFEPTGDGKLPAVHVGGFFPPKAPVPISYDPNLQAWYLEGWHRASGQWVKLAKFNTEGFAEAAIMACHSKTQPDKKKVSIVWEDFSAFKVESYTTVRWMR